MNVKRITYAAIIVGVVLIGAALFFIYMLGWGFGPKATDPSYALITSPLNDAILFVNDPVYVRTSAMLTHRDFAGADLYVDGEKYVLDKGSQAYEPKNKVTCTSDDTRFCGSAVLSHLWMSAKAGTHSLSVCLYGDLNAASPWRICTDKVSVAVTDLSAPPASAGTVPAQPGDTIASMADKFGLPPVLVAAVNPKLDPGKPLASGTTLSIPSDPSLPVPSTTAGSSTSAWTVTTAKMSTGIPIDKGYCYYSLGYNYWTRIPAEPQTFIFPLDGKLDLTGEFKSLTIPPEGRSLALECWGWSGASLVPLGTGKTTFVPSPASTVHLQGDQFALDATLGSIPGVFETMTKKLVISPPVDLTSTNNVDVCVKHGTSTGFESIAWAWICKSAVEVGVSTLVWDWFPPIFPIDDPKITLVTAVDGYHVYMVPAGGKPALIKTITDPNQKALNLGFLKGTSPLLGSPTFFVRAFLGSLESADSNHYTLGSEASGLATITLYPSFNHFGGKQKIKSSTPPFSMPCSVGSIAISGSPSIGGGEVAVGYDHWWPEDSCVTYNEEYSRAYIGFDLSPVKGLVSTATLNYRQGGYTSYPGYSCARNLGTITSDPSYDLLQLLPAYGVAGTVYKFDVTSAVRDWMAGTPNNGFVFVGADESLPPECGGLLGPGCIGGSTESCWTTYSGFQLIVTYFKP